jgi:APA family basic amino acid/polyamine antiporter
MLAGRLLIRKPIESVRIDSKDSRLRKSLGLTQLVLIGVGCIIGAGVYVMTGTVAANYAGPAVVVSFLLAGLACGMTALCYAELSSSLPVAGASYSYAYTALGEVFAWALGWMLSLEFGLAGSALAAGAAGYLVSLLAGFGIDLPTVLTTSLFQPQVTAHGGAIVLGHGVNVVAVAICTLFAMILVRGVSQSARVNATLVTIKVGILIAFVIFAAPHVRTENWQPFVPANQGGFAFGWIGVFRGASVLFFAYLGFEAVATTALEARNPQRDVPLGILGALAVAAVVYVAVALVLTGVVSYRALNVADPVAVAVEAIGKPGFALIIKLGALIGLCSVFMVNTYAHSRVCFSMSWDGLLPRFFSNVHPRFRTPYLGTYFVAAAAALGAALLPISLLGDLVSLGTGCVFITVACAVMVIRGTHPDLPRPFRVPGGGIQIGRLWLGIVPVLSLILTIAMVGPVLADMAYKAWHGQWIPAEILLGYVSVGAIFYLLYGLRHSKLAHAIPVTRSGPQVPLEDSRPGDIQR